MRTHDSVRALLLALLGAIALTGVSVRAEILVRPLQGDEMPAFSCVRPSGQFSFEAPYWTGRDVEEGPVLLGTQFVRPASSPSLPQARDAKLPGTPVLDMTASGKLVAFATPEALYEVVATQGRFALGPKLVDIPQRRRVQGQGQEGERPRVQQAQHVPGLGWLLRLVVPPVYASSGAAKAWGLHTSGSDELLLIDHEAIHTLTSGPALPANESLLAFPSGNGGTLLMNETLGRSADKFVQLWGISRKYPGRLQQVQVVQNPMALAGGVLATGPDAQEKFVALDAADEWSVNPVTLRKGARAVRALSNADGDWLVTTTDVYSVRRNKQLLELLPVSMPQMDEGIGFAVSVDEGRIALATGKSVYLLRTGKAATVERLRFEPDSGQALPVSNRWIQGLVNLAGVGVALSFDPASALRPGLLVRPLNDGSMTYEPLSRYLGKGEDIRVGRFWLEGGYLGVGIPPTEAQVGRDDSRKDEPVKFVEGGRVGLNLRLRHPCAGEFQGLRARLIGPGRKAAAAEELAPVRGKDEETVAIPFNAKVDEPGNWQLELTADIEGRPTRVGPVLDINFSRADVPDSVAWAELLRNSGLGTTAILLSLNLGLFLAARRSDTAWRLVTSGQLGAVPLKLVTLAASFWPLAQLWVLDRYFLKTKTQVQPMVDILPLPLTLHGGQPQGRLGGEGATVLSTDAVALPWQQGAGALKRLWIEGATGMGKTALSRWVQARHFGDSANVFEAWRRWGCVVVAIEARSFIAPGDDVRAPTWVLDALKDKLSFAGLSFEDDRLLANMLRSGTLGLLIDGLHEAGRPLAVASFAQRYPRVPMVVTSQEPTEHKDLFTVASLPPSMSAYAKELVTILLEDGPLAAAVLARVQASGLHEALQSGYDVRLVCDLARELGSERLAELPTSRAALYEAAMVAGWPRQSAQPNEERARLESCAWVLVADRKPHEDRRRMVPDVDLTNDLLERLEAAPAAGRPVRLVKRVPGGYAFAHDQMHNYLAARRFTMQGLSVDEMCAMLQKACIWSRHKDERKALWVFVATMLDTDLLEKLLKRIWETEEWDSLRRELERELKNRSGSPT